MTSIVLCQLAVDSAHIVQQTAVFCHTSSLSERHQGWQADTCVYGASVPAAYEFLSDPARAGRPWDFGGGMLAPAACSRYALQGIHRLQV